MFNVDYKMAALVGDCTFFKASVFCALLSVLPLCNDKVAQRPNPWASGALSDATFFQTRWEWDEIWCT